MGACDATRINADAIEPAIEHGTLTNTAIGRCPAPPALASSAAPITVTASARRSNTLAGNSTWVR